jgi:MerR family transcriptional regulator, copper efflux regulator
MTTLTIGRAAQAAGVNVETIRFYERRGLVTQPPRPRGGYRAYSAETVSRIRFIRRAQEIGFSLREIEELLSLRTDPRADCGDVREKARAKLDIVDQKIAELKRVRVALNDVISACPGHGALRACSILEALEPAPSPPTTRGVTRSQKRGRA